MTVTRCVGAVPSTTRPAVWREECAEAWKWGAWSGIVAVAVEALTAQHVLSRGEGVVNAGCNVGVRRGEAILQEVGEGGGDIERQGVEAPL